ncbi:hypothetical protein BJY52DRAFT_1194638 [Lactarius psammicola]|nr:hypothetical protein BJY52DRAFT_1194638 [Lactarius psammicola]
MPPKKCGSRGKDAHGLKSTTESIPPTKGRNPPLPLLLPPPQPSSTCCQTSWWTAPSHHCISHLHRTSDDLHRGTTSAPSAPALYDLLPDGMMEGSQPQPPPPAAVKAKSAGGVDTLHQSL